MASCFYMLACFLTLPASSSCLCVVNSGQQAHRSSIIAAHTTRIEVKKQVKAISSVTQHHLSPETVSACQEPDSVAVLL